MRRIHYEKINFLLSVVGFIGSIGFYIGVLAKVYRDDTPSLKDEIRYLKKQNTELIKQLDNCTTNNP